MNRSSRYLWRAVGAVGAVALGAALVADRSGASPPAPAAPAAKASPAAVRTRAFVVTYVWNSFPGSADDCPDGFNPPPDKELAISRLPADQQDAYRRDESKSMRILTNRGPHGENVCLAPTVLPDPGFKLSQSQVQEGFDLARSLPAGQLCSHPKMLNPAGARVVDNQLSRVLGCIKNRRADGFFPKYFVNQMRSGEYAYLVEVTGDLDHNGDVEVGLYASADPIVLDAAGRPLSHASLSVTSDPKYQHRLRGHITNGVLTTDPADILLPAGSVFPPLNLRNAVLRLTFKPDGSAEGALGGYQDWLAYYKANVAGGGIAETSGGPFQCTGLYYALKHAADGYKDPTTGECTAISSAYRIEAIPAFVIHPAGSTQRAQAGKTPRVE